MLVGKSNKVSGEGDGLT